MVDRVISSFRHLSVLAVVIALVGELILYGVATLSLISLINTIFSTSWESGHLTKESAAGVLKIIDLVLVAIGLHIVASGIYQLFVDHKYVGKAAIRIDDFGELKSTIVKIAGIILVVDFLEQTLTREPDIAMLYHGSAIAIVVLAMAAANWMEARAKATKAGLDEGESGPEREA